MRTRVLLPTLVAVLIIIVIGTAGWLLRDATRDWLFHLTGENQPLPQVRGLFQYLSNYTRPAPETDDFAAVAHAGVNPFGVNTFLQQEVEPAKRERQMQVLRDAGFRWIRQEFTWEDIEIYGKGDFEDRRNEPPRSAWEKYDHIVELAEEYDIDIIARLSNPPAWTRALTNTVGTRAPPDNLRDYGDFVETVVERYKGRIRYYQLWNEPNIYPEWGENPVDPVGYTKLLCEGYRRAKAVDPDIVILSGALAQTIDLSGRDLNDFFFLQRMYDAGAGDCFDILTTNAYLLWSAPTDHRMRPLVTNYARTEYIRDIMVRNGDAHKPIWISEMNSNAVPVGPDAEGIDLWGAYGQVSLETQAEWAPLAYERAQAEWPYVGVVNFWFFKPASDLDANQAYYYFRMLEPDFTPLPVFDAMKAYANQTPRMYTGTHQEDHWAVTWEGEWFDRSDDAAMLGRYRIAGQGATAHVCVEDDQFEVVRAPGSDDQARITIEKDDDGCLTLSAEPGVAIDGFVVVRESGPVWLLALAALVGVALIGWGVWRWRPGRNPMRITYSRVVTPLLIAAAILTTATTASVAQTEPRLEQLQIDLWPEFDEPEMLIIYRGTLPADVPLPATVTLRVPASVGGPHAVAYNDGSGNLFEAQYSTTTAADWLVVTLETPTPNFQLELYDDLDRAGEERSYTFLWPGDYAVDRLSYVFLPPPGASEIQTEPALSPLQQGTGSNFYGAALGSLAAGEESKATISYRGGPADADAAVSLATSKESNNVQLIAGAVIAAAALALVIGGGLWYTRRPKPQPAKASRPHRRRAKSKRRAPTARTVQSKPSPAGHCTQCGRRLEAGDRFCGYCGTQVEEKTE